MATNIHLDFDPADVLGVSRDASLQEIRDAYRAKVKRYHPDAGGEDWAFRIVSRSYEVLSSARVVHASRREQDRTPPPPPPEPTRSAWNPGPGTAPPTGDPQARAREGFESGEWVREGAVDPTADPTRLVDVERLTIVYEADNAWLLSDRANENHFLSCSLNIAWPDPELKSPPSTVGGADRVLQDLAAVVEELCVQSRATSSRSTVVDGRFAAWVSYPNSGRSAAAFAKLRQLLHDRGFAVKPRSRDVLIPRQWR